MHRLTQLTLLLVISTFLLAAMPAQEPPPATPAPTSACPPFLEDACDLVLYIQRSLGLPEYTWIIVLIAIVILVAGAFLKGLLSIPEEAGKSLPAKLFSPIRYRLATWRYLGDFIEQNRHFGFRGMEWLALKPIDLDQAYVTLDLMLENETGDKSTKKLGGDPVEFAGGKLRLEKDEEPLDIADACVRWPRIGIIGDAGCGEECAAAVGRISHGKISTLAETI